MATKTKERPRQATTSKQVAVKTSGGGVPAALAGRMKEDSGKGTSSDQSDSLVPLLYVLQPLSPQVLAKNNAQIPGAEAGDLWLRSSISPIAKGDDGIVFQPCHFSKDWVEWIPRKKGGGFVGRHKERPASAVKKTDPDKPTKISWKTKEKDGNDLVETRYMAGLVHQGSDRLPYIIPFTSTGHSVVRGWMPMIRQKNVDGNPVPAFGTLYRLKTTMRSNNDGEWFVISVAEEGDGWIQSEEDYERGKALFGAFDSGTKQAEAPVDAGHDEGETIDNDEV